jgi:hypothetical protein
MMANKGWVTIFADDMESGFPGSNWNVLNLTGSAEARWDDWTCWYGDTPSRSAGCAATGAVGISCGGSYPHNMNAWMVYGPFSLTDPYYTQAEVTLRIKVNSEEGYDFLKVMASVDGNSFSGVQWSGAVEGPYTFDLTDVYQLGNLIGQSQVWFACIFQSDASENATEGGQVDDIVIRAYQDLPNESPEVTVSSPNGGESWPSGSRQSITYTATDPDGDDGSLAIGLDYSLNSGSSWTVIANGQTNTGSYDWTLPAVTSSTARVRVRASDGPAESSDVSNADFTIVDTPPNTLGIGTAEGASGASVTVDLTLENLDSVKGIQADIGYDPSVAIFVNGAASGRASGMTASAAGVGTGLARVVLYYDGSQSLSPGSGTVGQLTFTLIGPKDAQTDLDVFDPILSDPDGDPLSVLVDGGGLTITQGQAPRVDLAVLKNPGRARSLQIMVTVLHGSGSAPTVTAAGNAVAMSSLGNGVYRGQYWVPIDVNSVTVNASDTNDDGQGTDQVTVTF